MLHLPGLSFDHGEDIAALREAVQQFAAAEIAPRAFDIDRSDQFPTDLWRKMGALGVLGITVDEQYGGAQMGYLAHIVAMEEISRASAAEKLDTLGMRGSHTGELVFQDCEVPAENVLGGLGKGVNVLMSGLDFERTVLSGGPLGIMAACMDEVVPYVHERQQFGQPIG